MGKCTADVALLLDVLAPAGLRFVEAVTLAAQSDLTSIRLGVPRAHFVASDNSDFGPAYSNEVKAEAVTLFEGVLDRLRAAIVQDPADIPHVERLWSQGGVTAEMSIHDGRSWNQGPTQHVVLTEYYDAINAYLSQRQGGGIRNLADLVAWNEAHPVGCIFLATNL